MAVMRKSFAAPSPGEARSFASDWLSNFADHGPLQIKSIRVSENHDLFVATVVYKEMTVETTPRHFEHYDPVFLKSA